MTSDETFYGILEDLNIKNIQFGLENKFPPWYGSSAYFSKQAEDNGLHILGPDYYKGLVKGGITVGETKKDGESLTSSHLKLPWLDQLFVCDYCFKYTGDETQFLDHMALCQYKEHYPGKIKYCSSSYVIRRVKCNKHIVLCQSLSLFTKLLLDNKSLFFNIDHYEYYLIYENGGHKPLGFFSRDILSFEKNNLGTILVFPPYQRKGLGTLLIEFSYAMTRSENIISGPEKPLSPFGAALYLRYWAKTICRLLLNLQLQTVTINDIMQKTKFRFDDIILALQHMQCLVEDQNSSSGKSYYIDEKRLQDWVIANKISSYEPLLKDEYLLLDC